MKSTKVRVFGVRYEVYKECFGGKGSGDLYKGCFGRVLMDLQRMRILRLSRTYHKSALK